MLIFTAIHNALDNFVEYVNHRQEMWNDAASELRNDIKNIWQSVTLWCYECLIMPFVRIKNRIICKRYPWLFINSGVYPWADNRFDKIWIDCMPPGWRKRFGWSIVRDIDRFLKEHNITDYHIDQVKEKYGELRWYDNGSSLLYNNVIRKYEDLSRYTCVYCGKPAPYMSLGWICPYCESCKKKFENKPPKRKFQNNPYYE